MTKGFFANCCLLRREQNSLILIVSVVGIDEYQAQIKRLGEKIISIVKDYFEVAVSIAVSERHQDITSFSEMLYQAIRLNDFERLEEMLNQLVQLLDDSNPSKQQTVNACTNLYYFICSFFEGNETSFPYVVNIMEELNRLGSRKDIIQWIIWFKDWMVEILKQRKDSKVDKIAERVRAYVMEHYRERITLGQVAEALNISQGYLSTAFKKQSGESFTNYIAQIKIEKAKQLIVNHEYMMYEISDMLGFDNSFYFSKVFKKVTGMSPKEFELECFRDKSV